MRAPANEVKAPMPRGPQTPLIGARPAKADETVPALLNGVVSARIIKAAKARPAHRWSTTLGLQ